MTFEEKRNIIQALTLGVTVFLVMILGFSWVNYAASPIDIITYFGAQAGKTVGVSAGVPENPFSKIAQQLEEKEEQLQEKEEFLARRELELEKQMFSEEGKVMLGLILTLVVSLFLLLGLNFYFDHKRQNNFHSPQKQ
ncbi:MAG: hypothetical protein GF370_03900 [Candidatus Nealsonbacteria bacterium]|nr:hypothetical protein [Candidatus Nealsonbacteria bacterium]